MRWPYWTKTTTTTLPAGPDPELVSLRAEAAGLRSDAVKRESLAAALERECAEVRAGGVDLARRLGLLQKERDTTVSMLARKLADAEAELAAATGLMTGVHLTAGRAHQERKAAEADAAAARAELATAAAELASLRQSLVGLREVASEAENAFDRIMDKLDDLAPDDDSDPDEDDSELDEECDDCLQPLDDCECDETCPDCLEPDYACNCGDSDLDDVEDDDDGGLIVVPV
jgi:chromosome segregation ATPase